MRWDTYAECCRCLQLLDLPPVLLLDALKPLAVLGLELSLLLLQARVLLLGAFPVGTDDGNFAFLLLRLPREGINELLLLGLERA